MKTVKGILGMLLLQVAAFGSLIWLSGCSFKVETGWHGRTGIDDQTISPEFRASSAKGKY